VPVQQMHHPAPDIVPVGLLPAGLAGLAGQVAGGEPADGTGLALDRPGRFALGGQVQPERANIAASGPASSSAGCRERRRGTVVVLLSPAGLPDARSRCGHRSSAFLPVAHHPHPGVSRAPRQDTRAAGPHPRAREQEQPRKITDRGRP
jgi:hypothetical protein